MSNSLVTVTELEKANIAWMANHTRTYLESGGVQGHIVDMTHLGGHASSTTLLLRTIGRKSGETRILPLLYSYLGGEIILMASRGGSDVHPAWYFNMSGTETVAFQIGTQAFRGYLARSGRRGARGGVGVVSPQLSPGCRLFAQD